MIENDSRIRVAARVRPLLNNEKQEGLCVTADEADVSVNVKNHTFHVDHIFNETATQFSVYTRSVQPLVNKVIGGYNATVLAYGQTGSGKTFTMGTGDTLEDHGCSGIIPRVLRDALQAAKQDSLTIQVSFIEIYNEVVKDLLHPSTPASKFFIYESPNGQVALSGVQMEQVCDIEGGTRLLKSGIINRSTCSTLMNSRSSRSHCIFTIYLFKEEVLYSKFHLVDLAGSERCHRAGTQKGKLREASNINKSLLGLTKVISALASQSKRHKRVKSYVPYRESKLTRLLKDSLGGECLTLMLVCVSPALPDYSETLNSLRYAIGARGIKNKPQVRRVNIVKRTCREAGRRKQIESKRRVLRGPPVTPIRKYVRKDKPPASARERPKPPLSSLTLDQIRTMKKSSQVPPNCPAPKTVKPREGELERLKQAFHELEGEVSSKTVKRDSSVHSVRRVKQVGDRSLSSSRKYRSPNTKNQMVEQKRKISNLESSLRQLKVEKKSLEQSLMLEERKTRRAEGEKRRLERQIDKLKTANNATIGSLESRNKLLERKNKEQAQQILELKERLHRKNNETNWFRTWKSPALNKCKVLVSNLAIPTSS